MAALLGVNIDHVATLRQARGTTYPDPVNAALICEQAGAEGITLHLREDRRHIQDDDVRRMRPVLKTHMNLEMAVTPEMVEFAKEIKPHHVCFVPEKRQEVTTEGGLDVVGHFEDVKQATQALAAIGCEVSLFIDADIAQIDAADGHYGDGDCVADVSQHLFGHRQSVGLRHGAEHCAAAKIVGSRPLGGKRLFHGLGRYAHDHVRSHLGPDTASLHVLLPHMNTVRSAAQGDLHVVVDDEGNAIPAAQGFQLNCLGEKRVKIQFLFPKLHAGSASLQCGLHLLQ